MILYNSQIRELAQLPVDIDIEDAETLLILDPRDGSDIATLAVHDPFHDSYTLSLHICKEREEDISWQTSMNLLRAYIEEITHAE